MRAYIDKIDITGDKKLVVKGTLSRPNIEVKLTAHAYVTQPENGIWDYTLRLSSHDATIPDQMVPFKAEATWTGSEDANGVRIVQPTIGEDEPDHETILLKAKRVDVFTSEQENNLILDRAVYDMASAQLIIDVRYAGGSFVHDFALEWDGITRESYPPQYDFRIVDLSEYDPSRAIIPAQLRFDIDTPLVTLDTPAIINLTTVVSAKLIQVEVGYSSGERLA